MINNLAIDAMLDEYTRSDWKFEQTPNLPAQTHNPAMRVHIDLQIGPLFITIGENFAQAQGSQPRQEKETA